MIKDHLQLPEPNNGLVFYCTNSNEFDIRVIPNIGGTINFLNVNEAYKQPSRTTMQYICVNGNQWFTLGSNR